MPKPHYEYKYIAEGSLLYTWSDNTIMGFSHTHYSGVGMTSGGDILFQPTVGNKMQIVPGPADNPDEGYRSRFSHDEETASPGYYSVMLRDYNVKVELTSARRVAFHRYTFPETADANIIIDLGHQIGTAPAPGDHLVPVIVDGYLKGHTGFDAGFVYDAMRIKALEKPKPPVPLSSGRSGLEYYLKSGYTPVDKVTESVSNTLELAYDDWCIAQMARALGKDDDYTLFMERAKNYSNVWDRDTEFMRPRKSDGSFLEMAEGKEQEIVEKDGHRYYRYFDPLLVGVRPNRHYTESNAWQYIWSVQHDVAGLISLFGSNDRFNKKLDSFFDMNPAISGPKYIGVVGTIGQYVHGNQPSHHVAYLYNYSGEPWKTQYWTRQICEQLYRPGPGGLCGNEDMGSLSSWYVLSAMGFYPVTPGNPVYSIGSPLFGKTIIRPARGVEFIIEAENNSPVNKYIQSATLNGEPLDKPQISHGDIMKGGRLSFVMGPEPRFDPGQGNKPD